MLSIVRIATAGFVIALLAGPALADGGSETIPAKKVPGMIKKEGNQIVKDLKQQLLGKGGVVYQFCDAIDNASKQVKDGTLSPSEALTQVANTAYGLAFSAASAIGTAQAEIEMLASDIMACAEPTVSTPLGVAPGDCGAVDLLKKKVNLLVAKATVKAGKKLKQLDKKLMKEDYESATVADVVPKAIDIAPTPEGGNPAPDRKQTEIDYKSGGNLVGVENDGKLCVGGTADPANGATVTVKITAPDGTETTQEDLPINGCRWEACFPPSGAGNLPEGNYKITVTHGTYEVTSAIGV